MAKADLAFWPASAIVALWGTSLWGILQIQHVRLAASHLLCGPWGCGPPLFPLLAYQGFWAVLLSLPTWLFCRNVTPSHLRRLGWSLLAAGFGGFLIVGVWDAVPALPHWLPRVSHLPARYWVPRYLLAVITQIDVPIVQTTLAGFVCTVAAKSRARCAAATPDASPQGAGEIS